MLLRSLLPANKFLRVPWKKEWFSRAWNMFSKEIRVRIEQYYVSLWCSILLRTACFCKNDNACTVSPYPVNFIPQAIYSSYIFSIWNIRLFEGSVTLWSPSRWKYQFRGKNQKWNYDPTQIFRKIGNRMKMFLRCCEILESLHWLVGSDFYLRGQNSSKSYPTTLDTFAKICRSENTSRVL